MTTNCFIILEIIIFLFILKIFFKKINTEGKNQIDMNL